MSSGAKPVSLLVATDRVTDGTRHGAYGNGRGKLVYEELTVSVPPGHEAGSIEWSEATAGDPTRSFVVTRRRRLDEQAFRREVASRSTEGGTTAVFAHGYNNTFAEAAFRLAQLASDAADVNTPILFSWPSEAAVTGYVADRDAVTYARDDLAHVLAVVADARPRGKAVLAGHSMGGWLVMETLRQLRLEGRDHTIAAFEVALAAPDIDIDVFRRQVAVVGPLSPPLTILVSKDDRALMASQQLAGGRARVGAADVDDPRLEHIARQAKIRIVDISSLEAQDPARHDRFVRFAAIQSREMAKPTNAVGSLQKAGAYVFNAAGTAVASPFTLAGRALGGQ
jgi:esterase/lipase superfamily enzyme